MPIKHPDVEPATISLAKACRRFGITTATALKLMPSQFPQAFRVGGKRLVPRREFENWMREKLGDGSAR